MEPELRWLVAERLVWPQLIVVVDPLSSAACAVFTIRSTCVVSNSVRTVRWNRSIFPVVVGDRGWVSRCSAPFSRQIRSSNTSTGGRWKRSVNTVVGQDLMRHAARTHRQRAVSALPFG